MSIDSNESENRTFYNTVFGVQASKSFVIKLITLKKRDQAFNLINYTGLSTIILLTKQSEKRITKTLLLFLLLLLEKPSPCGPIVRCTPAIL